MRPVLFTDLSCPFCYATETRLEALGATGAVDWRGVEHEPDLPVPMEFGDRELEAELEEEVASVRDRAPDVPIAVPPGKPNTGPALLAVVAALRTDPARGTAFRQAVYRGYWRDGSDISDPGVLAVLGAEYGLDGVEARHEDAVQVASWRLDWERAPQRGVPLLVREDGETLYGLHQTADLARFLEL